MGRAVCEGSGADAVYRVAVLGDSRVFDTYYATDAYSDLTYGYHKTFPHLLQRMLARRDSERFDCVHIPDHFRGRTVQNNILRLALIDPECVVLCDAIWETLLSRKHFSEYAEKLAAEGRASEVMEYSDEALVDLYEKNLLSLSPAQYAARIQRIASWFIRRRRRVIWLTTPVPPESHLGGLHYAGNYRPIKGWHRCLATINNVCTSAVNACGGEILDLDRLMKAAGGAQACLIDQWHFSATFHQCIAEELAKMIPSQPAQQTPAACISRKVMVQGPVDGLKVYLVGPDAACDAFRQSQPEAAVLGRASQLSDVRVPEGAALVLLLGTEAERQAAVQQLRASHRNHPVILFEDELTSIDNPAADRSAFGNFK